MRGLTDLLAAQIKGMLRRGDKQSDIAAYFSVNPGRIAEISTMQRFPWVKPCCAARLPPPGPYDIRLMKRDILTQKRRGAAVTDIILNGCADLEEKLPPDTREKITPVLARLMHGAELLERPL